MLLKPFIASGFELHTGGYQWRVDGGFPPPWLKVTVEHSKFLIHVAAAKTVEDGLKQSLRWGNAPGFI